MNPGRSAHARTGREGLRVYMLFATAEVFCVFLPVLVHGLVLVLQVAEDDCRLVDLPDLLYAAVVLSGLGVCKYLVAYFTSPRQDLRRARVFFRVLVAGAHCVTSALVLGLFFQHLEHGARWVVADVLLHVTGILIFLVASSDYFGLTHPD